MVDRTYSDFIETTTGSDLTNNDLIPVVDSVTGLTENTLIGDLVSSAGFAGAYQPLDADLTTLAGGAIPAAISAILDATYEPIIVATPSDVAATVATSETTTSTSYTDLATSGPAVTCTTETTALVLLSVHYYGFSVGVTLISPAVSGATTIAADDSRALRIGSGYGSTAGTATSFSQAILMTGLTAGSNTFTLKYRVVSGNGFYAYRTLLVIPLA